MFIKVFYSVYLLLLNLILHIPLKDQNISLHYKFHIYVSMYILMQLENLQDRYSPWDSLQNIISIHNQDNEQHPNDNKYVESSIAYRLQEFMNSGEFFILAL